MRYLQILEIQNRNWAECDRSKSIKANLGSNLPWFHPVPTHLYTSNGDYQKCRYLVFFMKNHCGTSLMLVVILTLRELPNSGIDHNKNRKIGQKTWKLAFESISDLILYWFPIF